MEKKMEITLVGYILSYSPPEVDRVWDIWDLFILYPKPYSIYFRGAIGFCCLRFRLYGMYGYYCCY